MTEQTTHSTLARGDGESYEAYRQRRTATNKATKQFLKGVLFHDSFHFGTFINWDKRELKAQRAARKAQRKGN
jgi:hypothetical protein